MANRQRKLDTKIKSCISDFDRLLVNKLVCISSQFCFQGKKQFADRVYINPSTSKEWVILCKLYSFYKLCAVEVSIQPNVDSIGMSGGESDYSCFSCFSSDILDLANIKTGRGVIGTNAGRKYEFVPDCMSEGIDLSAFSSNDVESEFGSWYAFSDGPTYWSGLNYGFDPQPDSTSSWTVLVRFVIECVRL